MQVMNEGVCAEQVLAALLHDTGHLLSHRMQTEAMDTYGVKNHEGIGADYLRENGFSERICVAVEKHVDAKRYLVATHETYKQKLSGASLQTLKWQGGPMSEDETILFEQHPWFNGIIKVRLWDEQAKDANAVLLPLQHFRELLNEYFAATDNKAAVD